MIKCILFDFDGTLIDTNEAVIESLKDSIESFTGRVVDFKELIPILGKPIVEQMKYFSEEMCSDMVEHYRTGYRSREEEKTFIFENIEEMLRVLKSKGYKIGITSNKSRRGINYGLNRFNLVSYIDFIISVDDVEKKKPHPECINKVIKENGYSIDELIIIGDSPHDINCGINAGIKTALVSWTLFPMKEFKSASPDYVLKDPLELVEVIEKENTVRTKESS
ncbi:pyrophosphatase PpaX [Clostridium sediminicola]|uniref:HAD family hydrolase n=1 Tax=Clostridium sediminicola TaxID=3114879 RepID=UPI0031F23836